ncbi:MAG: hypothetical protein NT029_11635 [Armatimonadetes bacterium]|nr:hypothetical protein [Armatimonadota bacterium]
MTLTLNLPPDIETMLCADAASNGMDVTAYASRLLDEAIRRHQPDAVASDDQWECELRRFIDSLPRRPAPLPPNATHRSSFYEDAA